VIPPERLWVLTNDHLRDIVVKQLPEVPAKQILAEPAQRNTAAAIGLAASVLQSIDTEAVMGVFPSDHVISKNVIYRSVVKGALKAAREGHLVVAGIQPRWPETGYGYIEFPRGCSANAAQALGVRRFHEKPKLARAKRYVAAGNFFWNSGMFFWRAEVLLDQLRHHLPKTATLLASLPPFGSRQFAAKLKDVFPLCDNISIDYAVLEKACGKRAADVAVRGIAAPDFGWNDVGSWNAVYELLQRDAQGNAIALESLALDSHNNFVDARGKLVALVGVRDLIVVDTADALLVAARDRAQEVGEVVKLLERRNRHDLL
jgi:mannose-1-phosphate guanylyltransferase